MKSSSNLIEASQNRQSTLSWIPVDFSEAVSSEMPTETTETAPTLFEDLTSPQVQWKETPTVDLDQATEPAAPMVPLGDGQPLVRRWIPGEVRPILPNQPAEQPVDRNSEAPSLEEVRASLIQEALVEASKILQNAQVQAAEMVRQAQERSQEVLTFAHQQGWESARMETNPMIEAVTDMVSQVRSWSDDMYAQSQTAVFNLVQEIAKTLFCDGLQLDSDMLQQTFNRILANARSLGDLRIYINPEDAINLGPYWREYQISMTGHQMEIIPSDSIRRGGCFVDGQLGTVDGRVETQYKAVMDALATSIEGQSTQQ